MAEQTKKTEDIKYKNETVGKVILDLSHYPGEDFYCDGEVEDTLLSITRDRSPVEYAKEIEEKKSWPILYHLSPQRENIVEWLPLTKSDKVLEVGSGCGAVTGVLSRKAGSVTCVDLSRKRSRINAYRHSDCENVTIKVGNFRDIEPELDRDFDVICLIGVFEYGISYIGGETPFEDFLDRIMAHVKKGGRIVIAIENKLGLKYFAGCREDHLGTYFSGIENYPEGGCVRTFSRPGLEEIFRRCGAPEAHFYYPYPDYKFMTTLYSDKRLPGKGELSNNLRNFDRERLMLFDEKSAFDGIAEDGLFPVFSNSYLVVLGPDYPIAYARYSNDRAPQYRICTEMVEGSWASEEGKEGGSAKGMLVRKRPLSKEAVTHVESMEVAARSLEERYRGGELLVNPCRLAGEGEEIRAEFEFAKGVPLTELLDGALEKGDMEGFLGLFREYLKRIDYHSEMPISDYDLVFSNILVDGDTWTLIDYEWTFGKEIETRELAFRAVYCYLLEDEKREHLPLDRILEELGITPEEGECYREKEREFQRYVTGERLSMPQLRDLVGGRVIRPWKLLEGWQDMEQLCRVQVYEDRGRGYSEEDSYFVQDAYQTESLVELNLSVSGDVHTLRIDPMMDSCIVKITEMTFNGERVPLEKRKLLLVNGRSTGGEQPSIVFATTDPNIGVDLNLLDRRAANLLYVSLEVTRLPMKAAQDLCGALAKHIRL